MARWSAAVTPGWDLAAWRDAARAALRAAIDPADIDCNGDAQLVLGVGDDVRDAPATAGAPVVPRRFLPLAATVLCHRDAARHALLYRLLWRLTHGEPHLLSLPTDTDMHRAAELARQVQRDSHKMKAFVRFRQLPGPDEHFVAWFEPSHWIIDRVAPFFARRFAGMRWAILTPYRSAIWNGEALSFGAGAVRSDAPGDDASDDLWRTYYAHIFNPARINPRMMRQEMPQKYWKNLPETQLLPTLLREAGQRVEAMVDRPHVATRRRVPPTPAAHPNGPEAGSLDALRDAARDCRACELWKNATQTVFGEGPPRARIVLIGEQPGDREDLSGHPFVGPAGQMLDRALAEIGLDRGALYITNAVKHFRFEMRGRRRLHKNPDRAHVDACSMWLQRELALVRPRAIVCLGASAASIVLGRDFKLMRERGTWRDFGESTRAFATVHPSWILRQPDEAAREAAYAGFVADLRLLSEPGATG